MFYVVSYDISDDKRRNRVGNVLLDFGKRVQYSVFECILDDQLLKKMSQKLCQIISEDDSVRIYTLCAKCEKIVKIIGSGQVTKEEDVYIL